MNPKLNHNTDFPIRLILKLRALPPPPRETSRGKRIVGDSRHPPLPLSSPPLTPPRAPALLSASGSLPPHLFFPSYFLWGSWVTKKKKKFALSSPFPVRPTGRGKAKAAQRAARFWPGADCSAGAPAASAPRLSIGLRRAAAATRED